MFNCPLFLNFVRSTQLEEIEARAGKLDRQVVCGGGQLVAREPGETPQISSFLRRPSADLSNRSLKICDIRPSPRLMRRCSAAFTIRDNSIGHCRRCRTVFETSISAATFPQLIRDQSAFWRITIKSFYHALACSDDCLFPVFRNVPE
jgi:hypothetical protein